MEVLLLVTLVVCTDSMIFLWVVWTLLSQWGYYNDFKRSWNEEKSTSGNRKYVTLTIFQKLEIIRRLESGDSQGCGYVFIEPSMINYLCYLETDKLRSFMTWRETELPFQVTDIETAKISTVGQDVVYLVNCSAFQTSTRNWACDWKSIFVMKWNWRTHSLRAGCKILKNQQLKEISNWNTNLLSCAA